MFVLVGIVYPRGFCFLSKKKWELVIGAKNWELGNLFQTIERISVRVIIINHWTLMIIKLKF